MKMRMLAAFSILGLLLTIFTSVAYARSFNFNFNNGRADRWYLGNSRGFPTNLGEWSVENGTLIQDSGYDGVIGLIEDYQFSTQSINANTKPFGPSGATGIVAWYKNDYNLVSIVLSSGQIGVGEVYNNSWTNLATSVDYNINENRWVNLKVKADSETGDIDVYMDDEFVLTYHATTPDRFGQSGVIFGNAGGAFDDYRLKEKIH